MAPRLASRRISTLSEVFSPLANESDCKRMSYRLIEIVTAGERAKEIEQLFNEARAGAVTTVVLAGGQAIVRGVLAGENVEPLTSTLDPGNDHSIRRVLVLPVEAILPALKQEVPGRLERDGEPSEIQAGKFVRLSREELRGDIEETIRLDLNFLLLVVLSSIVAGIGILQDSLAVLIGAMVIAPFLGPNVALAFGSTIGDLKLVKQAARTGLVGTCIAVVISVGWGVLDPAVEQIAVSPRIGYRDVVLALVCGFAGVLSILVGQAASLVGVMVAAALLPPLMRAGLFLGGGLWLPAANDSLVFLTNVICLNLAGITTFYVAGIRPARWWQEEAASRHRRRALVIWTGILLLLAGTILLISRSR